MVTLFVTLLERAQQGELTFVMVQLILGEYLEERVGEKMKMFWEVKVIFACLKIS